MDLIIQRACLQAIRNVNKAYKFVIVKCNSVIHCKNVIHINGGKMINVDVSVKRVYVKKVIFEILLYVVAKRETI